MAVQDDLEIDPYVPVRTGSADSTVLAQRTPNIVSARAGIESGLSLVAQDSTLRMSTVHCTPYSSLLYDRKAMVAQQYSQGQLKPESRFADSFDLSRAMLDKRQMIQGVDIALRPEVVIPTGGRQ